MAITDFNTCFFERTASSLPVSWSADLREPESDDSVEEDDVRAAAWVAAEELRQSMEDLNKMEQLLKIMEIEIKSAKKGWEATGPLAQGAASRATTKEVLRARRVELERLAKAEATRRTVEAAMALLKDKLEKSLPRQQGAADGASTFAAASDVARELGRLANLSALDVSSARHDPLPRGLGRLMRLRHLELDG